LNSTGGVGAASTNGSGSGARLVGGGTTTVASGHGLSVAAGGVTGFDFFGTNQSSNIITVMASTQSTQLASIFSDHALEASVQTIISNAPSLPIAITSNIKKNQALAAFAFTMADSILRNPAAGKTVNVTRSVDGGAFGAGTLSAVTEVSNGVYSVDFGAGDLNGNVVTLRATATGCGDTLERIVTQP
jgi:hypothetical protein